MHAIIFKTQNGEVYALSGRQGCVAFRPLELIKNSEGVKLSLFKYHSTANHKLNSIIKNKPKDAAITKDMFEIVEGNELL